MIRTLTFSQHAIPQVSDWKALSEETLTVDVTSEVLFRTDQCRSGYQRFNLAEVFRNNEPSISGCYRHCVRKTPPQGVQKSIRISVVRLRSEVIFFFLRSERAIRTPSPNLSVELLTEPVLSVVGGASLRIERDINFVSTTPSGRSTHVPSGRSCSPLLCGWCVRSSGHSSFATSFCVPPPCGDIEPEFHLKAGTPSFAHNLRILPSSEQKFTESLRRGSLARSDSCSSFTPLFHPFFLSSLSGLGSMFNIRSG